MHAQIGFIVLVSGLFVGLIAYVLCFTIPHLMEHPEKADDDEEQSMIREIEASEHHDPVLRTFGGIVFCISLLLISAGIYILTDQHKMGSALRFSLTLLGMSFALVFGFVAILLYHPRIMLRLGEPKRLKTYRRNAFQLLGFGIFLFIVGQLIN